MKILGIETSCDETAVSVISGEKSQIKVLANVVSSQIDLHKPYGGVIPELAAREHVLNILPVLDQALTLSKIDREKASQELDAVAVTTGPGLITSLLVGVETAKSLSLAWNLPLIPINHIEGHIYSNFIDSGEKIKFPCLVLTVSGGHTMLVLMTDHFKYQVIGETRDDAAGEAFDKAAQLMNLGYPGGPLIAEQALKFEASKTDSGIEFPRPMLRNSNFDFSFSGLKTSLLYKLKQDPSWPERIPAYCFEFQKAIAEVLTTKTIKAALKFKVKTIMLSGGVSANLELKNTLKTQIQTKLNEVAFFSPPLEYTTDNAVMIATAGYYRSQAKKTSSWDKVQVDCNSWL